MPCSKAQNETKSRILSDVKNKRIKFIQLQFTDIAGVSKSCEIPGERIETVLKDGLWFDGSSIEGFARIYESDMFLKPDINTYLVYPGTHVGRIICDIYKDEKTPFEGCSRGLLKKLLKWIKDEYGYEFKVGPELEFFLFKNENNGGLLHSDNSGYFDTGPRDPSQDFKHEIVPLLNELGFNVEMTHHEVAPSQHEIDIRYDDALKIADTIITIKDMVKTIAKKHGLKATFMPKPENNINGSGMHTHQSLWKNGKNVFYSKDNEYGLSEIALAYIAGNIYHAEEISAILSPTVNSYKRLVPGYEAPVYICWGQVNRSALIRVPKTLKRKKDVATRIEIRNPDPSCNPYLAFVGMLELGMYGIKNNLTPPEPVEENVYHFDEHELKRKGIKTLPENLLDAIRIFEKSQLMKEIYGEFLHKKIVDIGKKAWNEYHSTVSDWEKRYL